MRSCCCSRSAASTPQQDIYSSAPLSSPHCPPLLVWFIHPFCLNTDVYFGRRSGLDSLKPSSCTSQSQPDVTVFAAVVQVHTQVSAWRWRHHCRNMQQHSMQVTVLKFIAGLISNAAAAGVLRVIASLRFWGFSPHFLSVSVFKDHIFRFFFFFYQPRLQ